MGVCRDLAAASVELTTYQIADRRSAVIRSLDFARLMGEYGPAYLTARGTLIELLRRAAGDGVDLRSGPMLRDLREAGAEVEVSLSDGSSERFDLVVGCDGIHSGTRELIFGSQPGFDTGWVAWTWWGGTGIFPPRTVRELWLAGALFGVYPVPGRAMYLVAVPDAVAPEGLGAAEAVPRLRSRRRACGSPPGLALEAARRSLRRLRKGRVVLCGDAGTAFLPTAGVGASAALRSAAALADELSRAGARLVPPALDHYLERTTKAMRANQRDSRRLARAMFLHNDTLCRAREVAARRLPARSMIGSILAATRERV